MVTYCVTKIIPTYSPVIGQFFDTMIVASVNRVVIMTHQNQSWKVLEIVLSHLIYLFFSNRYQKFSWRMACLGPCPSGKQGEKVTCPKGKTTCPRQPNGFFCSPAIHVVSWDWSIFQIYEKMLIIIINIFFLFESHKKLQNLTQCHFGAKKHFLFYRISQSTCTYMYIILCS